jgi:hypothetical protein
MRAVVKIKSNLPCHDGYYTQWRDQMKPGDEEYTGPEIQVDPPALDPIKKAAPKKKVKK